MQHYFPGIPIEDQRTNAWFTAKGFERFVTEYDLIHTYDETSETPLPQTQNVHYGFLEKEHRKINKRAKKIQVELGNHTDAFVNKERLESYRERVK